MAVAGRAHLGGHFLCSPLVHVKICTAMKKCSDCLETKPLGDFFSNGHQPSGKKKYKPRCRKCEVSAQYQRYMSLVEEFFTDLQCQVCGYSKSFSALQLHHRDPSDKDYAVSKMANYSKEKLYAEMSKCDLLCANCHAEHHFGASNGSRPRLNRKATAARRFESGLVQTI